MSATPARWAPWLAAAAGLAFTVLAFYPGYLSFDSADQWQQARHFAFNDLHPPAFAMLWHLVDRIWPGPGGMFVLQALLYWAGLALLIAQLNASAVVRAGLVLLLGLWPPLFGLLPHLWKDVPMAGLLTLAAALAMADLRRPLAMRRWALLLCLLATGALRHNALPALLPFAGWWLWREADLRGWHGRRAYKTLASVALTVLLGFTAQLPARHPAVTHTNSPWSVVALWDIAAVSIAEQRLLFPPGFAKPELTLDELDRHFREDTNTTIYVGDKLRHSLGTPYSPAQRAALARAWLLLPFDHARAYFQHRLRLSKLLFGFDRNALPDYLVLSPGIVVLGDNPPVHANASALHRWVQQTLDVLVDTPLFAGWLYLLLSAALAIVAWRRRAQAQARLVLVLIASALLYTLPLILIAGSAEFRYLIWLVQASVLSLVLLVTKPSPVQSAT